MRWQLAGRKLLFRVRLINKPGGFGSCDGLDRTLDDLVDCPDDAVHAAGRLDGVGRRYDPCGLAVREAFGRVPAQELKV